jgi:predicted transcriptional regulator of viral defense system
MTVDLSTIPDRYLAEGRYSASLSNLCRDLGVPDYSIRQAYQRWRAKGWAFSPTRGLYVFVPSSHRSHGVIPPLWYVDPMMRHLRREYYVGLLSAAEQHSSAHQAPQVFQVFVDRELEDRVVEGHRLEFHTHRSVKETPTHRLTVPSGFVRVSSREATVADLVAFVDSSGGWSNVATAIGELASDALDPEALASTARRYPLSVRRRIGWVLDRVTEGLTEPLRAQLTDLSDVIDLVKPGSEDGLIDRRWGVRVSSGIEVDW